jgi:hypothetical protein
MPRSSGDASPPPSSVPRTHFDALYRDSSDPWQVTSAWYERRKYAITVAALPLSAADLASTVDGLVARLKANGDLIAVHHRAMDRCHGYDGFNVHASLADRPELREIACFDDAAFALRVFRKQASAHHVT